MPDPSASTSPHGSTSTSTTIPTNQNNNQPIFPQHTTPRIWFLPTSTSPLCVILTQHLLHHGDTVIACLPPSAYDSLPQPTSKASHSAFPPPFPAPPPSSTPIPPAETTAPSPPPTTLAALLTHLTHNTPQLLQRLKLLPLDPRSVSHCQTRVAEVVAECGRIDIVLCCADGVVTLGSVEEFCDPAVVEHGSGGGAMRTEEENKKEEEEEEEEEEDDDGGGDIRGLVLVRNSFEANFFTVVNVIQATLPHFRQRSNGHFIVLTGTTGHLGTPGLGMYCASQWAIEGYCDTLAYEVATFNVRMTIVQPNIEVGVLTNKVVSAGRMEEYAGDATRAPLFRDILSGLLEKIADAGGDGRNEERGAGGNVDVNDEDEVQRNNGFESAMLLQSNKSATIMSILDDRFKEQLVTETVHAIIAIGGHENPPSRHIVGHEAVASVKEKLKTVSQELEDYCEASAAADCIVAKDEPH